MIEPLDYIEVGQRIKQIRRNAEITQEQLAEMCSLTPGYISRIETGASHGRFEIYYKISEALNVSVAAFLPSTAKNTPNDDYIKRLTELTLNQKELLDGVIHVITDFNVTKK